MKEIRVKKWLFMVALMTVFTARAQQDTATTPTYGWTHSLVSSLTATQVSYTDWSQGGDNALAYAISIDGKSTKSSEFINWANGYKFAYGQTRLGDQGFRKTDDRIDIASEVSYKTGWILNPYFSATLKSQFTRGYKYDATGTSTAVSDFFDPAYLTQTAGVTYQPMPEVKTRLGAGLREILAPKFALLYTDDPTTSDLEKSKVDGGLESVTEVNWKIAENILFTSKLELFDAFKHLDQVIVRNDNMLTMKINKYLVTTVEVQLINERQISPKTQIKQTLSLGFSYTLI